MKSPRKMAFTLIELLVTIGVIALLASLLLPALSRAKEGAKRIVCANNMKQVSLGFSAYLDAYDDYFPPLYPYNDVVGNVGGWAVAIYRASDNQRCFNAAWANRNNCAFYCPNQTKNTSGVVWDKISYGVSYYGVTHTNVPLAGNPPLRLTRIQKASQTFLVGDVSTGSAELGNATVSFGIGMGGMFMGRHTKSDNVLFVDGHTETFGNSYVVLNALLFTPNCWTDAAAAQIFKFGL